MPNILLLLTLASAQAQPTVVRTAPPAPPPPPIVRVTPPPPIAVTNTPPPPMIMAPAPPAPPPYYPGDRSTPPATLEVRVAAEGQVLWEDSLRVGPMGGASIMQNRSEAPSESCPPSTSYPRHTATNFRLNVHPMGENGARAIYNLDVNWSRPGSSEGCVQGGNRTVSLQQPVELARGQEVTIRGDGGLAVRIRRR